MTTIGHIIESVAGALPAESVNDLPMIRQALNDGVDCAVRSQQMSEAAANRWDQDRAVKRVQGLLRSKRSTDYQPKTGERCHCKPGIYRDNCPDCEGTGWRINFAAIRAGGAR